MNTRLLRQISINKIIRNKNLGLNNYQSHRLNHTEKFTIPEWLPINTEEELKNNINQEEINRKYEEKLEKERKDYTIWYNKRQEEEKKRQEEENRKIKEQQEIEKQERERRAIIKACNDRQKQLDDIEFYLWTSFWWK